MLKESVMGHKPFQELRDKMKPTTDCCNQIIIPARDRLSVHTNSHSNCNGTSWGWIEGCTKNICWSNDSSFNHAAAVKFTEEHND